MDYFRFGIYRNKSWSMSMIFTKAKCGPSMYSEMDRKYALELMIVTSTFSKTSLSSTRMKKYSSNRL